MKHSPEDTIATLERREGRYYVLAFNDGQTLKVPAHAISQRARLGDPIHLRLLTEPQAKADRLELARSLLEEILNG